MSDARPPSSAFATREHVPAPAPGRVARLARRAAATAAERSPALDATALAAAAAALPLFVGAKLAAAASLWRAGAAPLAAVPSSLLPALLAADVVGAALLAFGYLAIAALAQLATRGTRLAGSAARAAVVVAHAVVAVIVTVSFRVNTVYGRPLGYDLLQMAGDARAMRSSVLASLDVGSAAVFVAGLACAALFPRLRRAIVRARFRRAAAWACVAAVAGAAGGAAAVRLRGVETYGLKSNAVVELARTWMFRRGSGDSLEEVVALARRLGARAGAATAVEHGSILRPGARGPSPAVALRGVARGMNLVLVVLESTPAREITAEVAPTLHGLAQRGVRFENHFTTNAYTFDAHYALMYSEHIRGNLTPAGIYGGPPLRRSLLEEFADRGYTTAVFHSSWGAFSQMSWLWSAKGAREIVTAEDVAARSGAGSAWSWGVADAVMAREAARTIRDRRDAPFAIVFSPICPHHPYTVPASDAPAGVEARERYAGALRYADDAVRVVVDAVREAGLESRTVVVVVSDHGETIATAGGHGLAFTASELRVPFFLHVPGAPEAPPIAIPTNHLDVAPTVAALFGVTPDPAWTGRDLLAPEVPARTLYVGMGAAGLSGLVDGEWAYAVRDGVSGGRVYRVGEELEPIERDAAPAGTVERWDRAVRSFDDAVGLTHVRRALSRRGVAQPSGERADAGGVPPGTHDAILRQGAGDPSRGTQLARRSPPR